MHEESGKDREQKCDEQYWQNKMPPAQGCPQNGELALKEAERRRSCNRKGRHEEGRSGQRHGVDQSALRLAEQVCLELLLNVAGAKKQQRLGNRMNCQG